MTRAGKCEICRERKVKCDEGHPRCGQCSKKNRPCRYEYNKPPKFVDERVRARHKVLSCPGESDYHWEHDRLVLKTDLVEDTWRDPLEKDKSILSIRSVKPAKEGKGIFHTFNTIRLGTGDKIKFAKSTHPRNDLSERQSRLCSVGLPIASPEHSLSARFIQLIGSEPAQRNVSFLWGEWISMVPARIGVNIAFDAAAEAFISACIAYRCNTENSLASANQKYSQALLSLQSVLHGSDEEARSSSETIAAVNMLLLFETVLEYRYCRWVSHSRGLLNLLVSCGPQADSDDMNRSLFWSSLPLDFVDAFLNGVDSVFDSPEWLYFPPPEQATECPALKVAYRVIIQQMIRLPRLIKLVREARANPHNIDVGLSALALAEKLYLSNVGPILVGATTDFARWSPTIEEGLAKYCPESLEFESVCVFEALIRYCYCRVFIVGLCRALREVCPFSPILNDAPLAAEDLENASLIAASVQYAEKQTEPLPLGPLLTILPLQVSYGTWWRIQRNDGFDGDVSEWERERACFMKNWCLDKSNQMLRMWNGEDKTMSKLEVQVAAMEGGPWMSWMKRTPRWR